MITIRKWLAPIQKRAMVNALIIAVSVSLLGATCQGAYRTAVVSATNLDNQFATTGANMDTLLRGGKITWAQYEPWAQFANKYKVLSGTAYTALKAGKDAQTTEQAIAIINQLENEIAMFLIFSQGNK